MKNKFQLRRLVGERREEGRAEPQASDGGMRCTALPSHPRGVSVWTPSFHSEPVFSWTELLITTVSFSRYSFPLNSSPDATSSLRPLVGKFLLPLRGPDLKHLDVRGSPSSPGQRQSNCRPVTQQAPQVLGHNSGPRGSSSLSGTEV